MKVDFEVVKIYKNDIYTPYSLKPKNGIYTPYSLKPKNGDSREVYAIKVEGEFFLLGGIGEGVFICGFGGEDK